jgi:hypothetical protein
MGMYTEMFVNIDLATNTPQNVIDVIQAMCENKFDAECLRDKPSRWSIMFNNGSYYSPLTECGKLTYDYIAKHYSLIAKGDIKNYESEIELFFEFIAPWSDTEFMGYSLYEESDTPTLMFKSNLE